MHLEKDAHKYGCTPSLRKKRTTFGGCKAFTCSSLFQVLDDSYLHYTSKQLIPNIVDLFKPFTLHTKSDQSVPSLIFQPVNSVSGQDMPFYQSSCIDKTQHRPHRTREKRGAWGSFDNNIRVGYKTSPFLMRRSGRDGLAGVHFKEAAFTKEPHPPRCNFALEKNSKRGHLATLPRPASSHSHNLPSA